MASFELPRIPEIHGQWGPPRQPLLDRKFQDVPYAPFSKSDRIGRFADWNDLTGESRQTGNIASSQNAGLRGAGPGGRRRDGQQIFGSGTANAFAIFHAEDEASFSLVDNKTSNVRRPGASGFGRGRGAFRGASSSSARGTRGRGNPLQSRGGQRGGRRGWRDWEKVILLMPFFISLINSL